MSDHDHDEIIYVLFGSQTGNSEQAALEFSAHALERLNSTALQAHYDKHIMASSSSSGNNNRIWLPPSIQTVCLSLDDFLELKHAPWTRMVVIFCSSYGMGQAPLGSYRFRELCDYWMMQPEQQQQQLPQSLHGVHYAICGLGDSKYRTYFQNPTILDQGLTAVGAHRIGPVGQADAAGLVGTPMEQGTVIAHWMEEMWDQIRTILITTPPLSISQQQLMQQQTIAICTKINPDFITPLSSSSSLNANHNINKQTLPATNAAASTMMQIFRWSLTSTSVIGWGLTLLLTISLLLWYLFPIGSNTNEL
jgi:sulfite reductase alpha subunit-like flavoprotein